MYDGIIFNTRAYKTKTFHRQSNVCYRMKGRKSMISKFKRGLAVVLASMLTVSSFASVASAEGATSIKGVWGTDANGKVIYTEYTVNENGEVIGEENITVTEQRVEATCTESGSVHYTANTAGNPTKDEVLPALGHNPGEQQKENEKNADCEHPASYDVVVRCTRCYEELSKTTETEGEALGHNWGEAVEEITKKPTCTENGEKTITKTCERCNAQDVQTEVIPATGHKWEVYETVKKATCTEAGLVFVKCTNEGCDAKEEQTVEATGHQNTTVREANRVYPTCTEGGSYDKETYCWDCHQVIATEHVTEEALGHDWKQTGEVIKESTCTEHGYGKLECSRCFETKADELPLKPHDLKTKEEVTKQATCAEEGSKDIIEYCTVCDYEKVKETQKIEKLAHDLKEKTVVTKEATCAEEGSKDTVQYCENCDYEKVTKTEKIDKIKHTLEQKEVIVTEPTCTEEGYKNRIEYCTKCDYEKFLGRDIIPAAHKWETVKVVKEPTCTETGVGYQECSVCGEKNTTENAEGTVTLDALGHDYETKLVEEKAPTCEDMGYKVTQDCCTRCDDKKAESKEFISALGHDWKEEYVSKEPTCTETGLGYFICARCDAKDTNHVIEKLPHTPQQKEVPGSNTFNGDCTVASEYKVADYCTACNAKIDGTEKTIKVPANKDHTYRAEDVEFVWYEPASGIAIFKCASEGCKHQKKILFAIDLKDENSFVVDKAPTCTEAGEGHYVATVTYKGVTATASTPTQFPIDATGHEAAEPVLEVIKAPTHEEAGLSQWFTYCKHCGEKLAEGEAVAVEPTGHEGAVTTTEVIKAPTCTEEGSYDIVVYCPECDKEISRETMVSEPTGHVWNDPVVENKKPATCTEEGSYETVVYCAACGAEQEGSRESHVIEKIEHTPVTDAAIAATCTKTGLTEGSHCLVCDTVLVEQKVTEKLAHTPVTDGAVAATCTKTGLTEGSHCKVCGEVLKAQKTTDKLAHKASAPVKELIKEATYTAPGSYNEVVYCADCHAKLSSTEKAIEQLKPQGQKIKVNKETKSKTYKAKSVKKAKKSFRISATAPSGKLTYKKLSGSSRITVGKSGKITVKKGTKKGTYKVRVKIYAPGTAEYKAVNKTITVKVVVK